MCYLIVCVIFLQIQNKKKIKQFKTLVKLEIKFRNDSVSSRRTFV
jgi:hypothetical protein